MKTLSKISGIWAIVTALWVAPAWSAPIAVGLEDLEGKSTAMDSQAKKVLVVFWATWCTSCRAEFAKDLPELAKSPGLDILTVNTDADRERAKEYVSREKISFKVFRDPSKNLRKSLQVLSVPHWAVYERSGVADWKLLASQGAFDLDAIKRTLGAP